jgi:hypothetical protein
MKKTFRSNVSVVCYNWEIKNFLVQYALEKGVPVFSDTISDTISSAKETYDTYPNLTFCHDEICGTSAGIEERKTWISVNEFMEYCDNWSASQPVTFKLTNDYDAKIDKVNKVVKVGCQTILYDVIDALYKEMYK